jgi:hypothetical protein
MLELLFFTLHSHSRSGKKYFFFGEDFLCQIGFFSSHLWYSTTFTHHINLKLDYLPFLARREF